MLYVIIMVMILTVKLLIITYYYTMFYYFNYNISVFLFRRCINQYIIYIKIDGRRSYGYDETVLLCVLTVKGKEDRRGD
jgi:hypothetical protein